MKTVINMPVGLLWLDDDGSYYAYDRQGCPLPDSTVSKIRLNGVSQGEYAELSAARNRHLSEEYDALVKKSKVKTPAERMREHFGRSRKTLQAQMLARGDAEECTDCGARKWLTIDHITPISSGGTNDLANLQFLCNSCNSSKGAK